jgi:hypothetical protein
MPPARAAVFCLLFVGITKRRSPAGANPGGLDFDPDPDPDFDYNLNTGRKLPCPEDMIESLLRHPAGRGHTIVESDTVESIAGEKETGIAADPFL